MKQTEEKSFRDLLKEVVSPGLCTVCGTCIAACPYNALIPREESFKRLELHELEITSGIYKSIEDLCEKCGFCYHNCPITTFNLQNAEKECFGTIAKDELGNFLEAYRAQAIDPKIMENAQNGGVATALLTYVLEKKLVEVAVAVTSMEDQAWKPKPAVIDNPDNLGKTQKTKYTPAATVDYIRSAIIERASSKIAVVATPCQVHGIWTTALSPKRYRKIFGRTKLIIGVFCYGTYSYHDLFTEFLAKKQGIVISNITKLDLDTEKMLVYLQGGLQQVIPRHELHTYVRESCRVCSDFTNRLADISLGGVGSPEHWTTVFIRTKRGKRIFDAAVKEGYVRIAPLSEDAIDRIKRLAKQKCDEGAR
ncbi:MAG: Coenzyme F420 hydrogenase/dehydrogenase, beta subunit C-terminal domain [Candidatus Bathyarchaeota archaeon]